LSSQAPKILEKPNRKRQSLKMNKKTVTILVGFLAGFAVSGLLFDAISFVHRRYNRARAAWNISRAERLLGQNMFDLALVQYDRAFTRLTPQLNARIYAQNRNNQALILMEVSTLQNDIAGMQRAVKYFASALNTYTDLVGDQTRMHQVQVNLDNAVQTLTLKSIL